MKNASRLALACAGLVTGFLFTTLALFGCPTGAVSPGGVTAIGLGVKDAICVVDHDNESVLNIIKDCNLVGDVAQEVSELLASTHAAEHRFAARVGDAGRDANAGK